MRTARQSFFTQGLRGVTMDDLVAQLGMSKKTLYAYFPSKTSLVEAVLVDKFQQVESELQGTMVQRATDWGKTLHELLACIQRHTMEIQPPFVRDIRRKAPGLFQLIERRRTAVLQRTFGELLRDGRRAGTIRRDIAPRLMVEVLLGAVQAIMNPPKMVELGLTPRTGYAAVISIVLEGVLSKAGREKR